MTPGKHGCVCVAIVLLVTVLGDGATPDATQGQHDKSVKSQETAVATKSDKGSTSQKAPLTFACIEEDTECNKDRFGYEAIQQLHRLIDDDHNGNVDQSESDEFLRDELQYTDGFERHSLFHNNDKLISVDDLWRAWKYSEVYNWTVDDVVDWLQKEVDLPQYSSIFIENAVSGPFLPRLASSNTFMATVLGIKNPVHKQKMALKAMDTVLFGAPPKRHSYIKDFVLVASLIFAVGGCWFAYLHHRYSQEQVRKMMIDLESLQKAEEALMDVQRKLEDAESRKVSSVPRTPPPPDFKEGTAVPQADLPMMEAGTGEGTRQIKAELEATLLALQHAETQLEHSWVPPGELQAWLQLTHELEQSHYDAKRQAAERQFQAAKEVCDKIKRRNKAFLGALRMAHSNSLDEIDQRILDARVALEEVKQDLQERLHRWHTMERLCGFPIITNPGLSALHQMLHGTREGTCGGGRLPGAVVGPVSVDEADEDMPPVAFPGHLPNGLSRPRAFSTEVDSLGPLPYALFPDSVHIETERQACGHKRGVLRRQPRFSYPTIPSVASKTFLRHRPAMGSTGSLSHLSRNAVNVNAAYSTAHSHSVVNAAHRSSLEQESLSPTSSVVANPVSFHLGDQAPDRTAALGYMTSSSAAGANNHNHARNKSITPSTVSSAHSAPAPVHPPGYHGYTGASSGGTSTFGQSASAYFSQNRSMTIDDSDDNLSQATMDSLPRSQSSGVARDRLRVNNGLDLVSHTQAGGSDSAMLAPCRLEKKPSKRKKLLNMFRKTPKQKPV